MAGLSADKVCKQVGRDWKSSVIPSVGLSGVLFPCGEKSLVILTSFNLGNSCCVE